MNLSKTFSVDLKNNDLEQFRVDTFDFIKNIFDKEQNDNFVLKEDLDLYIKNSLNKEEALEITKKNIIEICKDFELRPVCSGRELLQIKINVLNTICLSREIREIIIDIKSTQKGGGTSTGLKKLVYYNLNGEEQLLMFKKSLSYVNPDLNDFLLNEYIDSDNIYSNLHSLIDNNIYSICNNIILAIKNGSIEVNNLSAKSILNYINKKTDSKISDFYKILVKNDKDDFIINVGFLNRQSSITLNSNSKSIFLN